MYEAAHQHHPPYFAYIIPSRVLFVCPAMALHEGHIGGPGFRWGLKGATNTMKQQTEWDLQAHDLLGAFINTLAVPLAISKQNIQNGKGGKAEVVILKYKEGNDQHRVYHGTHLAAARSVLREGYFRESNDDTIHEFSLPGVYTSTDACYTLEPYAVSVMLRKAWSRTTPYVECVFVLQPRSAPLLKKRNVLQRRFTAARILRFLSCISCVATISRQVPASGRSSTKLTRTLYQHAPQQSGLPRFGLAAPLDSKLLIFYNFSCGYKWLSRQLGTVDAGAKFWCNCSCGDKWLSRQLGAVDACAKFCMDG